MDFSAGISRPFGNVRCRLYRRGEIAALPKAVKHSVALVIWEQSQSHRVLAVRRPTAPGEELPGLWGLPAGSQLPGESLLETARRVGRAKLGLEVTGLTKLAEGQQRRERYDITMVLLRAERPEGWQPVLPSRANSPSDVTYYDDWQWAEASQLREAAEQGSLCCQLFLRLLKTASPP
jgi:ADP-ribose pyrophosphatase YjhB (NUDIX family)